MGEVSRSGLVAERWRDWVGGCLGRGVWGFLVSVILRGSFVVYIEI